MTATGSLTKFYASAFFKCGEVALCPYILTLKAFYDPERPRNEDLIMGAAACVLLSTLVPILPTLTTITLTIAAFGACLALASMFVAYPIALLIDAMDSCDDHHHHHHMAY